MYAFWMLRCNPLAIMSFKVLSSSGFWLHPLSGEEDVQGHCSQQQDAEVFAVCVVVCGCCGGCVWRAWPVTQRGVTAADAHRAHMTRRAETLISRWGDQTGGVGRTCLPVKHTWGRQLFPFTILDITETVSLTHLVKLYSRKEDKDEWKLIITKTSPLTLWL